LSRWRFGAVYGPGAKTKAADWFFGDELTNAKEKARAFLSTMLQYRLDKEKAIVMISHINRQDPSSTPVLTIDYMRKVNESHVAQMVKNLRKEAALLMLQAEKTKPPCSFASPQEAKRARKLQNEPTTPSRT